MKELEYKNLTDRQLDDIFQEIKFPTPPRRHQKISMAFASDYRKRIIYIHGIGTGKTLAALYTMWLWNARKILVICPSSAFFAWRKNILEHTHFSYVFLTGKDADRKRLLKEEKKDIYITNYEGLKYLYGRISAKEDDSKKAKWRINFKDFVDNFDGIILDEIHKCAEFRSLQARIIYQLSKRAEYVIGLTGTPIRSNLLNLWGEFRVVDLGSSLGANPFMFQKTYFKKKGKFKLVLIKGADEKILQRISNSIISFSQRECLDLPKEDYIIRSSLPTDRQTEMERQILQELSIELEQGKIDVGNVLEKSQKLREVCGGFFYFTNNTHRLVQRLSPNPKIDMLEDILEETDEKIVIFHQYIEEGRMIEDFCRSKHINFAALRGEIRGKEDQYIKFISDPETKVMIAHPACASESYDFTASRIIIFYSNGTKYLERKQAEGRILRSGQTKACLYIDLILEGTIDEITAFRLETKKVLSDKVLNYIRNYHT